MDHLPCSITTTGFPYYSLFFPNYAYFDLVVNKYILRCFHIFCRFFSKRMFIYIINRNLFAFIWVCVYGTHEDLKIPIVLHEGRAKFTWRLEFNHLIFWLLEILIKIHNEYRKIPRTATVSTFMDIRCTIGEGM